MTPEGAANPRALPALAEAYLGPPPELSDLAPILETAIPGVVEAFYGLIREEPRAWAFVSTEERMQRLHRSLALWLRIFLANPPEAEERAQLAIRMADAHLVIGMPLELTLLGHMHLRRLMVAALKRQWPPTAAGSLVEAIERLNQAFQFDSLLLISTYHAAALRRERIGQRRLEELNQRLEESVRAQENLLRTTSHELRTPLSGLLGLLNLLQRGVYEDPEEQRQVLDDVCGAARRTLSLVDDLLRIARLDLGKQEVESKPFALRELVSTVLRLFRPRAEELGLRLELECPEGVEVHGDPERTSQVLSNLLQNAFHHTFEGGIAVGVRSLPAGGHVLIEVRDTGTGIDPELLPRLFDPFAQGGGSGPGLGLGLAVCRRLVLRMGGRIRAESKGPGHGSCFSFTLPLAGRDSAGVLEAGDPASPWRLLICDDDALWRTDLAEFLAASLPVHVVAVGDPESALEVAARRPCQLMLLDLAFPAQNRGAHSDGFELLRALATSPATMLTPKWLVTAHDPSFLGAELEHGWHDRYFEKGSILSDRKAFAEAVRTEIGAPDSTSEASS